MRRVQETETTLEFAGAFETPPDTDSGSAGCALSILIVALLISTPRFITGDFWLAGGVSLFPILAFVSLFRLTADRRDEARRLTVSRTSGITVTKKSGRDADETTIPKAEITTIELKFVEETATGIRMSLSVYEPPEDPAADPARQQKEIEGEPWPEDPSQLIPWSKEASPAATPPDDEPIKKESGPPRARHRFQLVLDGITRSDLPALGARFAQILELPIYRPAGEIAIFSSEPSSRPDHEKPMPSTEPGPRPESAPFPLEPAETEGPEPSESKRVWRGLPPWTPRGLSVVLYLLVTILALIGLLDADRRFFAALTAMLLIIQLEMIVGALFRRPLFDRTTAALRVGRQALPPPTQMIVEPEKCSLHLETAEGWLRWRTTRKKLRATARVMSKTWGIEARERLRTSEKAASGTAE